MQADGTSEQVALAALLEEGRLERSPRSPRASKPVVRRAADEQVAAALRQVVNRAEMWRQRHEEEVRARDELAVRLHALGWSWERIAAEVGMSRQALMKRVDVKNR